MPGDGERHRTISANGVDLHVVERGTGRPVILCHGFPELSYSWRHQLEALAAAGYRAVAPDQRGYGRTSQPPSVAEYDVEHLSGDLLGLLDDLGEERAVFVGHDWGAVVVWHLALAAPERVAGVVGLSVPFIPRTPLPPTELIRAVTGERFHYILYFQAPGPADEELARDPRRTIVRTFWSFSGDAPPGSFRRLPREGTEYLDGMSDPPPVLPPWLTEGDLEHYASEFGRTGFTGALNWYRNMDRNWELSEPLDGRKVTVPALFVAGDRDPVLRMTPPEVMDGWLTDLRGIVLLDGAGHWTQQERPDQVNRELVAFLRGLD